MLGLRSRTQVRRIVSGRDSGEAESCCRHSRTQVRARQAGGTEVLKRAAAHGKDQVHQLDARSASQYLRACAGGSSVVSPHVGGTDHADGITSGAQSFRERRMVQPALTVAGSDSLQVASGRATDEVPTNLTSDANAFSGEIGHARVADAPVCLPFEADLQSLACSILQLLEIFLRVDSNHSFQPTFFSNTGRFPGFLEVF